MTVDTKGVVDTPCKDAMFLGALVQGSVQALLRAERELEPTTTPAERRLRTGTSVDVRITPFSGSMQFLYTTGDKVYSNRMLTVHLDCDCDHRDIAPTSVSMSMGASGNSEQAVRAVLRTLSLLGPVYYQACDAIEGSMKRWAVKTPTVMALVASRIIPAHNVDRIVAKYDACPALFGGRSFETIFGISEKFMRSILGKKDYQEAWTYFDLCAEKASWECPVCETSRTGNSKTCEGCQTALLKCA